MCKCDIASVPNTATATAIVLEIVQAIVNVTLMVPV
jgi:hypothetical protein